MDILIAEDDAVSRRLLESNLQKWGHNPITCNDGSDAWARLEQPDTPRIAILDWMARVGGCRNLPARSGAVVLDSSDGQGE